MLTSFHESLSSIHYRLKFKFEVEVKSLNLEVKSKFYLIISMITENNLSHQILIDSIHNLNWKITSYAKATNSLSLVSLSMYFS